MFVDEHDRLHVYRPVGYRSKKTYVYVSLVCGHCHEEQRIGEATHKKGETGNWIVKVPRKPSRWLTADRRLYPEPQPTAAGGYIHPKSFDTITDAVAAMLAHHKLPPNLFYV